MVPDLAVIGIDSLDPYVLMGNRKRLPNLSKMIEESPTFISKSVFPVDTIPAWASIYTSYRPGNHGLLYSYDIFDPNLKELKRLDLSRIRGKTFWDYAGKAGCRTVVVYPMLIYPPWETNGIMVSKSPFDRRKDWLTTEIDVDVLPLSIKEKYSIPDRFEGVWGGFPGIRRLQEWTELGKGMIEREKNIGLQLFRNEKWNLFFIYFSLLDIIQHRLWRFFDKDDPTYLQCEIGGAILEYYEIIDSLVGDFVEARPDVCMIVMSDHGHRRRPTKTLNINEYLRKNGYLVPTKTRRTFTSTIRKTTLEVANRLNIEHLFMRLIASNERIAEAGKLVYSSSGAIDTEKSIAFLSAFAGIKSYPHGGIVVNRKAVGAEYEKTRDDLVKLLLNMKTHDGMSPMLWAEKREMLGKDRYIEEIFPDIVFRLKDAYGVGWEVYSKMEGRAYDHMVASGGHAEDGVFLLRNVDRSINTKTVSIIDVAPTILSLLGIDQRQFDFDGRSILA